MSDVGPPTDDFTRMHELKKYQFGIAIILSYGAQFTNTTLG